MDRPVDRPDVIVGSSGGRGSGGNGRGGRRRTSTSSASSRRRGGGRMKRRRSSARACCGCQANPFTAVPADPAPTPCRHAPAPPPHPANEPLCSIAGTSPPPYTRRPFTYNSFFKEEEATLPQTRRHRYGQPQRPATRGQPEETRTGGLDYDSGRCPYRGRQNASDAFRPKPARAYATSARQEADGQTNNPGHIKTLLVQRRSRRECTPQGVLCNAEQRINQRGMPTHKRLRERVKHDRAGARARRYAQIGTRTPLPRAHASSY